MAAHTMGESQFITLADGRKLHFRMRGSGSPTVILESGMGFSGALWGLVQPELSRHVSVVAYDRAGTGKSDWDHEDRTLDRITDDLEQLLNHFSGPLILVGYSLGGPIVRRVASRRTSDIRGIVLLDQTDERNPEYFTVVERQPNRLFETAVLWLMHVIGIRLAALKILKDMPADCRREVILRDLALKYPRIANEELKHMVPGLALLRDEEDPLEGIDVTVVSGVDPKFMSREYHPEMVKAHRRTAAFLDRGRLVEAESSAHFTPLTEPGLAVREINRMIELVRDQGELQG